MSFVRNVWFSEFREMTFSLSQFWSFFTVLLQIWREINLRPNSRQDNLLRPHTNKRPPTTHPTTLHSPCPPNHTLPTHPRTHLSHPPPHNHTLRTAWNKKNFCSIVWPKYSSLSRLHNSLTVEWERMSVNPQPCRFTNNSLSLPHTQSFSVYLSSWTYVVCACFLLHLAVYLCFVRCVFCDPWYIHFTFFHSNL